MHPFARVTISARVQPKGGVAPLYPRSLFELINKTVKFWNPNIVIVIRFHQIVYVRTIASYKIVRHDHFQSESLVVLC